MALDKIKNFIKVYKNSYIYDDLINAKEKLFDLNIQIEKKYNDINQLNHTYNNDKQKSLLFFLSDNIPSITKEQQDNDCCTKEIFRIFR
jgi:hypothetical protein